MDYFENHPNLNSGNPVEDFYRRHIINTKDNPIPQTLVVAILRILLTTCPNANRGSGGIDLHREWVSSIRLCLKYPKIYTEFIENNPDQFKIVHERIIQMHKDMNPKKKEKNKREKEEGESEDSGEDSNIESDEPVQIDKEDLAVSDLFKHENYRHSLISAKYIGQLLLFIQRHFQANHVIQGVYLSSLIVDANGIKVLLKFMNQDFHSQCNYLLRINDCLSII